MKKRRIAVLTLLCLSLLLLTACGKQTEWTGYDTADLSSYLTLGDCRGLSVPGISVTVTEEEVDAALMAELTALTVWQEVTDHPVQPGDRVRVRYTGASDEEAEEEVFQVPEADAADATALTSGLIGRQTGEEYTLTDTEQTAARQVRILSVSVPVIPSLTDELAHSLNESAQTAQEYRELIRQRLLSEKTEQANRERGAALWQAVVNGSYVLRYPEEEVRKVAQERREEFEAYAAYYSLPLEEFVRQAYDLTPEEFERQSDAYAHDTVKETLVLYALTGQAQIRLSAEEYNEGLAALLLEHGDAFASETELEAYFGVSEIEQSLLWDKAVAYLLQIN